MPAGISLVDRSGRAIDLGREIGRGGEASVYEVRGLIDAVAKVYHDRQSPTKIRKLAILPTLAKPELFSISAWPTEVLRERASGTACGLLMPRVDGHREIHQIYSPAQRRQHFPKSDWSLLVHIAMNCAAATQTIHEAGHVIGDVNQGGFLVSAQGTVRLIDCDSFQVRHAGETFRCEVGVPHFTPGEMQGADFKSVDRSVHQDAFGLATLIFHLLFMGRPPFAGRDLRPCDVTIEQRISERRFAFSQSRASFQMDVPPHAPTLALVPPAIADLFERAFRGEPAQRPLPADWFAAMQRLKAALRTCAADDTHRFSKHLSACPWCAIAQAGGPSFFTSAAIGLDFDVGFDLFGFWRRVERAAVLPGVDDFERAIPNVRAKPGDVPVELQYKRLGPVEPIPPPPELFLKPYPDWPPPYLPELDASSPTGAFAPLPVPPAPAFVPLHPADPPRLERRALPEPPSAPRGVDDRLVSVRARYREACRNGDYRTAWWGTVLSAALVPLTAIVAPFALLAIVPLIMAGLFGLTLYILRQPLRPQYRREWAAARAASDREAANYKRLYAKYESELATARAFNDARQREYERALAAYQAACAQLPERNAQRRAEWEAERVRIDVVATEIRARNDERLRQWRAHVEQHENARRDAAEQARAAATRERAEVDAENEARRARWREAVRRHAGAVAPIEDRNRARAAARARFDAERLRLRRISGEADDALKRAIGRWANDRSMLEREVSQLKGDAKRAYDQYAALRARFIQERDAATSGQREHQLLEMLDQHLVKDVKITGIGRKRKGTLMAYNVKTAADVTPDLVDKLRGTNVGPSGVNVLLGWRKYLENAFVFDPRRATVPPAVVAMQHRYQPQRRALCQVMQGIEDRMAAAAKNADERFKLSLKLATDMAGNAAKARADVDHFDWYAST